MKKVQGRLDPASYIEVGINMKRAYIFNSNDFISGNSVTKSKLTLARALKLEAVT